MAAALVGGVITKVVEWVGADKVKVIVNKASHLMEELVKFQLYTVKQGDGLEEIVLAHGCSTWDLKLKLNKQNYPQLKGDLNYLKVGMHLAIPRFSHALRI